MYALVQEEQQQARSPLGIGGVVARLETLGKKPHRYRLRGT